MSTLNTSALSSAVQNDQEVSRVRALKQPIVYDLYCGLGGWTEAFLKEGYRAVGYDIEAHDYGTGGYPGELRIQDCMTLHGSELRDADIIVASPPCQEFSYRAMPWKRAKALPPPYLGMQLFWQCWKIQHEASEAAGRYIPIIVENVCGAQKWIGRARWHFGSYYLWGDVPALMPSTFTFLKGNPDGTNHGQGSWFAIADSKNRGTKHPGMSWSGSDEPGYVPQAFNGIKGPGGDWFKDGRQGQDACSEGIKNRGNGSWFAIGSPGQTSLNGNPVGRKLPGNNSARRWEDREVKRLADAGRKHKDQDGYERTHPDAFGWKAPRTSSRSDSRKAASAAIAKIPEPLAAWIAQCFKPQSANAENLQTISTVERSANI